MQEKNKHGESAEPMFLKDREDLIKNFCGECGQLIEIGQVASMDVQINRSADYNISILVQNVCIDCALKILEKHGK